MSARAPAVPADAEWLRPQAVIFTLLAEHLLGKELAVFTGSFIEALSRVGIGDHATRSTLARMTRRGLLEGQRKGRATFLRMTPRCIAVLENGRTRIWETGAVSTEAAELWTGLAFSLPEAWRKERYDLTVRLTWAGFGPLQNGLWIAPRSVDVVPLIEELGLQSFVRALHLSPAPPTDPAALIAQAFDLNALAERYHAFIAAWEPVERAEPSDPLALTLRLSTQWLQIIGLDPRVPVHLLPRNWPAIEAQRLFRRLHAAHRARSEETARTLLKTIAI